MGNHFRGPETPWRDLLRVLAMPFQLASLLFVLLTSLLLGLFLGGDLIRLVVSVAALWLLLVWLTHFALHLIDDAAQGVRETQAASMEMVSPFEDARAWVHPALIVALGLLHYFNPQWPREPTLLAALLLFPASIGASAISGRALDALHPAALARVIAGLGPWYAVPVGLIAAAVAIGALLVPQLPWLALRIAAFELLLLVVYAGIGGVVFLRRHELEFVPRRRPESRAEQQAAERLAQRQQWLDALYQDLRVRDVPRATAAAQRWLAAAPPAAVAGDVAALLEAGRAWNEPRELPKLLRALVPVLRAQQQEAPAFALVEAGLGLEPQFHLAREEDAVAMIGFALHSGRRRAAARLLENCLRALPAGQAPGAALAALATRLAAAAPPAPPAAGR